MNTIPMTPDAVQPSTDENETNVQHSGEQVSPDMPVISVTPKEELSDDIVSRYCQHVIPTLDNSTSMSGPKIAELNVAKKALFREMAVPENRKGFKVSPIHFNSKPRRIAFGECATTIQDKPARATGGTDFELALQEVIKVIDEFKNRPNTEGFADRRPVVIFMSDGLSSANQATIVHLHEVADVISVAFGDDADRSMLKKISSDGQVHRVGTRGGELTKFLAEVGKTLSQEYQKNA